MSRHRALVLFALATAAAAGCHGAGRPVLHKGFGNYHREVTTGSPEAQRYFDQGIQLLYGFNHDEAIRSFQRAADLDPRCAMAWWGIAYAHGLHINRPEMTEAQSAGGWRASREALARIDGAAPVEQALIRAVGQRYAWPPPPDRKPLDLAYAAAMEAAWRQYPKDADVGALFAESLMDLQPWDLWTRDGSPKGRAEEIVAVLEQVLVMQPDHPGANHFYIHAVEASPAPQRALASADRLGGLVPGSGHLVHMPAHVYVRLGRYGDASDCNVRAIAADDAFFRSAPQPEFYGLYIAHNHHFLAYSAMMEGRRATALEAARGLEREMPPAFLDNHTKIADGFMPTRLHVMIRFGMWEEILDEPEPPEFRRFSRAMRHYARGVAGSALGRPAEARLELEAFTAAAAAVPDDWFAGNNPAHAVLEIARAMLEGEILFREGRRDEGFARLRQGVELEEALVYDEPPGWMQPVRHALGALLVEAGRCEEAAAVYRADLARSHDNGWSLLGLENALRACGAPAADLDRLAAARAAAWRRADVKPASSCYCAGGGAAEGRS
jgi:tetratricopeptide (TPR) repeat protein